MYYKVDWLEALPLVLLGLRTTVREDFAASISELTYGTTLRLPGQLYEDSPLSDPPAYVSKLQKIMCVFKPCQPLRHGQQKIYVPKQLKNCIHVFVRIGPFKTTLRPTYKGPFEVAG